MGLPYVGEIRIFGGSFAPDKWALCNGAALAVGQHQALFALIGTTYGGDGQALFNLPDLQGRVPMHFGPGGIHAYSLGETGGAETVTLTATQLPAHTHEMVASTVNGRQTQPTGGYLAQTNPGSPYVASSQPYTPLNAGSLDPVGGGGPHENMAPFLALTFIISLSGLFPSQT